MPPNLRNSGPCSYLSPLDDSLVSLMLQITDDCNICLCDLAIAVSHLNARNLNLDIGFLRVLLLAIHCWTRSIKNTTFLHARYILQKHAEQCTSSY